MKIKIKSNIRPLFYALVLTLSTYLLIDAKNNVTLPNYLYIVAFNLILLFFEIISIYLIAQAKLQQFDIPTVHTYLTNQKFIHFILIPFLLFSSLNLFIFFNPISKFNLFIIILTFIAYSSLFINIRAYGEDKFKLEEFTHFIYPTIIIWSVFSYINAFLSLVDIYTIHYIVAYLIVFLGIALFFFILFIEDLAIKRIIILFLLIASAFISILTILLFIHYNSKLRTSFLTTACFYLLSAIIFHKKDGTLSIDIIIEYIIFLSLNFTLLYGIS